MGDLARLHCSGGPVREYLVRATKEGGRDCKAACLDASRHHSYKPRLDLERAIARTNILEELKLGLRDTTYDLKRVCNSKFRLAQCMQCAL